MLYMETRVFIPTPMRNKMLDILHRFHFAATGMLATAKAYWPNMIDKIDRKYRQCRICTTEKKAKD